MTPGDPERRLFAYGTLMFAEVFRAVCGVERTGRAATLAGYACYCVRGHTFPAIVPCADTATVGLLYDDIDVSLWSRLDEFEGDFYLRKTLDVHCGDERAAAQVYVANPAQHAALSPQAWSADVFRAQHLAGYLARYT